jgi:fatty-acid desaturase
MTKRRKDSNDYLDKVFDKYVIAPILVVVGMLIVGAIIDGALNTKHTFSIILAGAGGIFAIGYYYHRFWKHHD